MTQSPTEDGPPIHVLVVDDDEDSRLSLRIVLGRQGYRVTEASDGAEALAAMAAEQPDLLITDGMMPIVDGAALIAAVRDDAELAGLPIILVQGHPCVSRGTLAATDGVLETGSSPDDVLRMVGRLTGGPGPWVFGSRMDIYGPLHILGSHAEMLTMGRLGDADAELCERSRALVVEYAMLLRDAVEAPLDAWCRSLQAWRAGISIESSVRHLVEAAESGDYAQLRAIGVEVESLLGGHVPEPPSVTEAEGATDP